MLLGRLFQKQPETIEREIRWGCREEWQICIRGEGTWDLLSYVQGFSRAVLRKGAIVPRGWQGLW